MVVINLPKIDRKVVKMKNVYPVIFTRTRDEKDTVLIEIPDLEILTEGYGIANAIEMARDAIGLDGITREDLGQEIPVPRDILDIDIEHATFTKEGENYISLVDVDYQAYRQSVDNKAVRRNVTLPNWLNQEAEKAHLNVSKVLQEALMSTLHISQG